MTAHGPRERINGANPTATSQLQLTAKPIATPAMPVTVRPCGERAQSPSLCTVVGTLSLCAVAGSSVQKFISFVISVLLDQTGVRPNPSSSDPLEDREGFEQPIGKGGKLAGDHGDAHSDHYAASADLERAAEPPKALKPTDQPVGEQADTRNGMPSPSE